MASRPTDTLPKVRHTTQDCPKDPVDCFLVDARVAEGLGNDMRADYVHG